MHIPDGLLNPQTIIVTGAASAVMVGISVKKVKTTMEDRQVPVLGVTAAFIFAAQMINFPVAIGTSGHLIGALLSSIILGPWATSIILSSILIIQSLMFGDGGVLALSANILNMAVIANFAGYYICRWFSRKQNKTYSSIGVLVGGCASVLAAAIAASLEIVLSGRVSLGVIMPPMILWHTLIGIGEGLITLFLVRYLAKVRQDLIYNPLEEGETL